MSSFTGLTDFLFGGAVPLPSKLTLSAPVRSLPAAPGNAASHEATEDESPERRAAMQHAQSSSRRRIFGLCLILCGCLFFAGYGYYQQTRYAVSYDFKTVYVGALCMIDGCDPYDAAQTEQAYLRHGADRPDPMPIRPYYTSYLPSGIFLVAPLALLPFGTARVVWLSLGTALFGCAALCIGDLCAGRQALRTQAVLAVFVASSTLLVMLGQPAMYAISLAVIAVWSFLRRRLLVLGVLAFALSLILKPHLAGLLWLFFLLSPGGGQALAADPLRPEEPTANPRTTPPVSWRRLALYTLGVALVLMMPGVLLAFHHPASAHWPQELQRNLERLARPGGPNNPGPRSGQGIADLQPLFALLRDSPRFYNLAALATFSGLLLMWLLLLKRQTGAASTAGPYRRGESLAASDADLMALAAVTALSFLPIYHQQYDTRLLLLIFPAVAVLASRYRRLGRAALALSALATVTLSHPFVRLNTRLVTYLGDWLTRQGVAPHPSLLLACDRPLPVTLLLLSGFFLYAMFRVAAEDAPDGQAPAGNP